MEETYDYYEHTFEITWEDGSTETVTTSNYRDRRRLPAWHGSYFLKELDHVYEARNLLLGTKLSGSYEPVREINKDFVKEVEHIETTQESETL